MKEIRASMLKASTICSLVTADAKFHAVLAPSRLAGHVRWVEAALDR